MKTLSTSLVVLVTFVALLAATPTVTLAADDGATQVAAMVKYLTKSAPSSLGGKYKKYFQLWVVHPELQAYIEAGIDDGQFFTFFVPINSALSGWKATSKNVNNTLAAHWFMQDIGDADITAVVVGDDVSGSIEGITTMVRRQNRTVKVSKKRYKQVLAVSTYTEKDTLSSYALVLYPNLFSIDNILVHGVDHVLRAQEPTFVPLEYTPLAEAPSAAPPP